MTWAVLDTNVVVSALIWGGKPSVLFDSAIAGDLLFCTSTALVEELRGVLTRSHLAARLEHRRSSVEQAIAFYASLTEIIVPTALSTRVSCDPNNDAVLALAAAAQADFIVTGDSDLLLLGRYAGIPIVRAA